MLDAFTWTWKNKLSKFCCTHHIAFSETRNYHSTWSRRQPWWQCGLPGRRPRPCSAWSEASFYPGGILVGRSRSGAERQDPCRTMVHLTPQPVQTISYPSVHAVPNVFFKKHYNALVNQKFTLWHGCCILSIPLSLVILLLLCVILVSIGLVIL